jgi:hypothetical protein
MLKTGISFICGAAICCMIVFAVRPVLPAMADESSNGTVSDNNTGFLANLLPDFDKIYRDALAEPFIKAESKIYDPDIADYYHGLMDKTGLTDTSR